MSENKIYLEWNQYNDVWSTTLYTWNDVAIALKVGQAFGGSPFGGLPLEKHIYLPPQEIVKKTLTGKEYKKFVNLVCKVNGITSQQLKVRNPECIMTLTEIQRTIEEVLKPQVKITQIKIEDI